MSIKCRKYPFGHEVVVYMDNVVDFYEAPGFHDGKKIKITRFVFNDGTILKVFDKFENIKEEAERGGWYENRM